MKLPSNKLVFRLLAAALMAVPVHAADLTLGERVLVSENNQNFNISVFPGAAGYDNTGTLITNPPLIEAIFGDGTVLDYNFFHSPDETIVSYASGDAGLIGDATSSADNINGAGENWSNVWTTTDPEGFTSTKDFNNTTTPIPNTFARSAELEGTIDISTLPEGTLYFMHGTFINQWTLTVTMTGAGQPDIVASDAQTTNGVGTNFGWVTDFSFVSDGAYDAITYHYTNNDRDGSRARFMGVVLDGPQADPAPIRLSITRNDPTSLFQLAWESQNGMLYNVRSSGDLSTELSTWTLVEGDIPADPSGITTWDVNPTEATLYYRVEEFPPPPLFSEGFEDDDGGFTVATTQGSDWAHGDPNSSGEGGEVSTGNGGSTNCWGTNIGDPGYYDNPTDTCLRSAVIDLTGVTAAELTFAQAIDLDAGDSVKVNIIDDTTDAVIATDIVSITDTDVAKADWESVGPVAIPAAALGQAVRIEWCLSGVGGLSNDFMGWYIDDVVVEGTTP